MTRLESPDLLLIPEQQCGSFHLKRQFVSFKEEKEHLIQKLSENDYTLFHKLYQKAKSLSKEELRFLEALKSRYPELSEIKNLLTFAYVRHKKIKKAEELMIITYREHPDHLIAKINYGDYCLRKKKFDKIPEIFSSATDLRELYPSKEVFHVTEFRGFMTLMGFYHHALKEQEKAECYHYLAARVDPSHPAVCLLGKTLYTPPLFKKFLTLFKKR